MQKPYLTINVARQWARVLQAIVEEAKCRTCASYAERDSCPANKVGDEDDDEDTIEIPVPDVGQWLVLPAAGSHYARDGYPTADEIREAVDGWMEFVRCADEPYGLYVDDEAALPHKEKPVNQRASILAGQEIRGGVVVLHMDDVRKYDMDMDERP